MKLHFYLNEQEVRVATNSAVTEVQDSTLDSGSITLAFNNREKPYAPFTKFRIYDENTDESLNFVIIEDNVERVSKVEDIFLHTFLLAQNTSELNSRQIRNSSFAQPTYRRKTIVTNSSGVCRVENNTYDDRFIPFSRGYETNYLNNQIDKAIVYAQSFLPTKREKIAGITNVNVQIKACPCTQLESRRYNTNSPFVNASHNAFDLVIEAVDYLGTIQSYLIAKVDEDNNVSFNYSKDTIKEFFSNAVRNNLAIRTTIDYYTENRLRINKLDSVDTSRTGYTTLVNVSIELELEVYYYSLLDIILDLREQDKQDTRLINDKKDYAFNIKEDSDLYRDLKDFIAPNMYFNNQNIFECVSEVLKVVDGLPTLDKDNNLNIEYVNDISKEASEIRFDNKIASLSSKNYENRLMTYYQNAREEKAISYPSNNDYAKITAKNYGVVGKDDYQFVTPFNIDYIDSIKILAKRENAIGQIVDFPVCNIQANINNVGLFIYYNVYAINSVVDYRYVIYEKSLSSLFTASRTNAVFPTTFNTIQYTRNSNIVELCSFQDINDDGELEDTLYMTTEWALTFQFGFNETQYTSNDHIIVDDQYLGSQLRERVNVLLNIKYHAITDGVTSVETRDFKHNGDMLVTSNNASVDLYRMGVNMLSNLSMLGNEKYTCTLKLSSFDTRLRKGSIWLDDNNERYIANVVKTTFSTKEDCVIVNVEFVKNFNMINQNTQLFNEKRFYQIDNNLVTKGYQLYTDYLYLSLEDRSNLRSLVCYNSYVARYMLFSKQRDRAINRVYFSSRYYDINENEVNLSNENNVYNYDYKYIQAPLHSYSTGTTLNFEVQYQDSLNARDRIVSAFKVLSKSTIYCKDDGFADYISLKYCFDLTEEIDLNKDFPLIRDSKATTREAINVRDLHYLKRDNEIFALNYQICVLAYDKEIIVSDTLLSKSCLIDNATKIKAFKVHTSDYDYSIIERKQNNFIADCVLSGHSASSVYGIYGSYTFKFSRVINVERFAITDENDNILIAFNKAINSDELTLYFFSSNKRLNLNE